MNGFLRKRGKLLSGPVAFMLGIFLLAPTFGAKGAAAMGVAVWMALWWVLRPVDIAVTSMLPIVIVAANCAYVLPVSTSATPVGFGLEAATQIRLGLRLNVLNMIVTTLVGFLCLRFVPYFSAI